MNTVNIFDVILKWFSIIGILAIAAFLGFGWIKGLYWEKELQSRKKHR